MLTFLFMGPFFSFLAFFLLFTSLWWLSVLYSVWLFLDRDTRRQVGENGRAAPRPQLAAGHSPTCALDTSVTSRLRARQASALDHRAEQPLLPSSLSRLLFVIWSMFCEPPEPGFYSVHSQLGQAVVIVIGRAHEALYAIPGEHCLPLRNRKGFVHLALRHRASLVPVYSFAENDIFRVKGFAPDSWQHLFQITFKKLEGISPCIFWGRGLFSNKSWGLVPLARPITTVVGRPIPVPQCPQPPEEQVDRYHVLYMKAVEQLLEEHRRAAASRLLLASPSPWPHPSPPPGPPSP